MEEESVLDASQQHMQETPEVARKEFSAIVIVSLILLITVILVVVLYFCFF